jgi:acyl-CoA synthetase (AMP-forming)/AMP-acid ligase II
VAGVDALREAFAADPAPASRLPALDPSDPTCIVWTSGTTGAPKGAVYDHERQAVISRNINAMTAPGERRLVVLPFPHVGYMTRMWDEFANASTIVIGGDPWSAEETLRLVRDERVTMMTGVPTQWTLLLQHPDVARTDFSRVRVAGIGGAPTSPELVRRMRETLHCAVRTRYTSTEAGVTTGTVDGDTDEVVATTVGRAREDVELRIVTAGARGEDGALPPGEVGEVVCRSPAMMIGYWRDPELTAEVVDAGGWLHTGDLGFLDTDDYLHLVGRLKEMYLRGGYNVYPAEVEGVLADHPAVGRAAVVGVPDPVLGEVGVAFVVPAPGAEPSALTRDGLRAWCRDRLADYKAPDRVVVVDSLPLNPTHKVDKQALARLADDATEP